MDQRKQYQPAQPYVQILHSPTRIRIFREGVSNSNVLHYFVHHLPRMNHIHTVLEGDSDNVILGKVGTNRSESFANLVCFIGLVQCEVRRQDQRRSLQTF